MANLKRVRQCIRMMQNAKNLNMLAWQRAPGANRDSNEAKDTRTLHKCGNTACFAGYLAISPAFKAVGGRQTRGGSPELGYAHGPSAVAEYLGISESLALDLVYCGREFYPVSVKEVKPEHVIAKLKLILSGELQ